MSAHPRPWPETVGGGAGGGSLPRGRWRRRLHRFRLWLRRLLRLRTGIKVDGVYFKELSALPLARALSPKGPGQKEYRVTFRDRSKQIIHATPQRQYGDLCLPARLERYAAAADRLRPGMRILDVGAGTGYTSAWLAEQVGAYGAVVALEADEESVEFAQRRYRLPNVAFEVREASSLDGETDESFDGVVWLREEWADEERVLAELWRLVKPGGWLLLGPRPEDLDDAEVSTMLQQPTAERRPDRARPTPPRAVIAGRPGQDLLIEKVADQRS